MNPDGVFDPDENTYTDGCGQKVRGVHPISACEGRPCVIHAPSDHSMRSFPTNLRIPGPFDIKQLHMERICPHGVGHPDPDDAAYQHSLGPNMSVGVHGCDGCCHSADDDMEELTSTDSGMRAMLSSLQDDLLDADDEAQNLRDNLDSLEISYATVKLSRDFYRNMVEALCTERDLLTARLTEIEDNHG